MISLNCDDVHPNNNRRFLVVFLGWQEQVPFSRGVSYFRRNWTPALEPSHCNTPHEPLQTLSSSWPEESSSWMTCREQTLWTTKPGRTKRCHFFLPHFHLGAKWKKKKKVFCKVHNTVAHSLSQWRWRHDGGLPNLISRDWRAYRRRIW